MTGAGTTEIGAYLAAGHPINAKALQGHLGRSVERTNQLVLALEAVAGVPLERTARGRVYTSNVAAILLDAQASPLPTEEALRQALQGRGVEVPEPVPSYTLGDVAQDIEDVRERLGALEAAPSDGVGALRGEFAVFFTEHYQVEIQRLSRAIDSAALRLIDIEQRLEAAEVRAAYRWWHGPIAGLVDALSTVWEVVRSVPLGVAKVLRR